MTQVRIRRVEDGAGDLVRASVSVWLVDAETRRRIAWGAAGWFGSTPDLSTAGVHGVAFELLGGNWYGTYKGLVS